MKRDLIKYLVLTLALTAMTASTTFASVDQSSVYQQQIEQISQQNEILMQQNEYLKQQTETLKQNQAYNQGYIEGQKCNQRYDHSQLYAGMGLGYVMGQLFVPDYYYRHRYCHWRG